MNQQLQDFYDNMVETHISGMIKDKDSSKSTPPILYLLMPDDKVGVCFIQTPEGISPMTSIKPVVKKFNPKAYLFCAEAWMKMLDKKHRLSKEEEDKTVQRMEKYGIRNEPDRQEILTAVLGTMSGEHHQRTYYIERDKTHRIIGLQQRKKHTAGKFNSRHTP